MTPLKRRLERLTASTSADDKPVDTSDWPAPVKGAHLTARNVREMMEAVNSQGRPKPGGHK